MSPRFHRTATLLALTTALGTPSLAVAQQAQSDEPDPNIPVQHRPRPDYDPLGIRAGSFLVFPSLTLSGLYDSNVFATKHDTDSDVAGIVAPVVEVNVTPALPVREHGGGDARFQMVEDPITVGLDVCTPENAATCKTRWRCRGGSDGRKAARSAWVAARC